MRTAYQVSLFCAILPLAAGLLIFGTWLATGWIWLMQAGMLTIMGGLVLVPIGLIALVRAWWLARNAKQPLGLSGACCAVLLFSNFPVAAGLVFAAHQIETAYTVVITNSSTEEIRNVRVFGAGCEESYGDLGPGEEAERTFWVQSEGTLEFVADGPTNTYQQTVDGYVTNGLGGWVSVTVNPDGSVSVSR
jgi:hypothetical protein